MHLTTPLIRASGNPGKLREFSHFFETLPRSHWDLQLKPADLDPEETGTTFAENAQQKARSVALATQQWAIADDSGLAVDALGGAPGVYSARYADTDPERIARVLQELDQIPHGSREAAFWAVIALCDPQGEIRALGAGSCPGQILSSPRGSGGFGYDPIFYVPELGLTFAEMTYEQKQQVGHRGKALMALRSQLEYLGYPG